MQKLKPMDESDIPLTGGVGYYTDECDFKEYRKNVKPPKHEVSEHVHHNNTAHPKSFLQDTTCHKFGAMGYT